MATVPHVTSGSGLRKFQVDGFLFDRVYSLVSEGNFFEQRNVTAHFLKNKMKHVLSTLNLTFSFTELKSRTPVVYITGV